MSKVILVLGNDNKLKILEKTDEANCSLTLFYGVSSENPEFALDSYINELKGKGLKVYDISDARGYMDCRLSPDNYVRIKSDYSSSVYNEESAQLAYNILLCSDNVVATIHAVSPQDALKRFLMMKDIGLGMQVSDV